jgi:hypothetical protein
MRNPKIYTITVIPLYAFWKKEIICKKITWIIRKKEG